MTVLFQIAYKTNVTEKARKVSRLLLVSNSKRKDP